VPIGTYGLILDHPGKKARPYRVLLRHAIAGREITMTFHRRLRRSLRVVAATAVAAAVAAPVAAAADSGRSVQIGGELVAPAQVSSWQAQAGHQRAPRLVQIGGALVSPEGLSQYQQQLSKAAPVQASVRSGGSGFGWSEAGVGFAGALGVVLLVAASAYVRRTRLSQA